MTDEELMNIAKLARKNAISSISGYNVGAALMAKSGTIYIGANIEENSIPNLSNCAERVALQNAMAHGEREFLKIAIVGGKKQTEVLDYTISPCGVCLQYILDFCSNVDILTYNNEGNIIASKVTDFLGKPYIFEDKL